MRQWGVLYSKENLEMWRNKKWVWVPLVFILLGIMQPFSSRYLPELIDTLGGMPEGTVLQIPTPPSEQVIVETLSQFGMVGVLILVLAVMGTVAAERQNGVAGMILVKPVPFISYISAKWAGMFTLTIVSFLAGLISAWYYTEVLIGKVDLSLLIQSALIYCLWFSFVISVVLLFSSMLKGIGAVAFASLAIVFGLSIITSIFEWLMQWNPAMLPGHAASVMMEGTVQ